MSHKQKVKAVENYIELLNTQNEAMLIELYTDDATVEDPYGSDPHVGIEAIKTFYQTAFDAKITIELSGPIRTAADSAAFAFQVHFNGMIIDAIDVMTFNEKNEVTSMKAYWCESNISQP